MERDKCILRSGKVPRIPAFPDLDSSVDGESNHEGHPQGNGDSHITSNGEENLDSTSLTGWGLKERTLTSKQQGMFEEQSAMLTQPLPPLFSQYHACISHCSNAEVMMGV